MKGPRLSWAEYERRQHETWRVFIGMWEDGEPEWAHLNQTFGNYCDARAVLDHRLARWATDSCEDCVRQAASEHARLLALPEGAEFAGEVEGEDYLLIRANRLGVDDLWEAS